MNRFGHYRKQKSSSNRNDVTTGSDLNEAIKSFQKFAGLNVTGRIDNATRKLMQTKRCQNPDYETTTNRRKRYATSGNWKKTSLKYYFTSYPNNSIGLTNADVDKIYQSAIAVWSAYIPITFTKVTAFPTDIKVTFASYNHSDSYPFDGPLGVLAHTFYPTNGNTHFDNSESWSNGTTQGTNLFQVMTHEFGHVLGLAHSSVQSAVMYPFYVGYNPNFNLDADDIQGIRYLYPTPTTVAATTTMKPTTTAPTTKAATTTHTI
jgi:hypothetical protein